MINNIRYIKEVYDRNINNLLNICSKYIINDEQIDTFISKLFLNIIKKDLIFSSILEEESYCKMFILNLLKNYELVNKRNDKSYLKETIWAQIKNNVFPKAVKIRQIFQIVKPITIVLLISVFCLLISYLIGQFLI